MVGGFASSCEAKGASTSEAPSPSHSERAACTFKIIICVFLIKYHILFVLKTRMLR
ncbi:hypothetical protein COL60_11645 [Bacillus pseudomycoides]|nr:hypothetical protein COO02_13095 [Bacillus pseudomycoides]PEI95983.1 hypothetical protein CN686_12855 [Bacillus pseudomycoides]PEM79248.1 hypothetical protein CN619_00160 [Bacillus pseudomycoides]PFZ09935.1 hypothetical protein COL60_11645 [Bacillus pseudomycoides]PGA61975.1 hypothetical protein COL84_14620 [Bacillus pseudomycoides]